MQAGMVSIDLLAQADGIGNSDTARQLLNMIVRFCGVKCSLTMGLAFKVELFVLQNKHAKL